MEDSGPPVITLAELHNLRTNLDSAEAREVFYEPATRPFLSDERTEDTGDVQEPWVMDIVEAKPAEAKRSVSQEIVEVAYRTAQEVTSSVDGGPTSSKYAFDDLIVGSSTPDVGGGGGGTAENEVPSDEEEREVAPEVDDKPRFFSNRSSTLPANLECKIFDGAKSAKLTRWEVFKRKFYLGPAHREPTRSCALSGGTSAVVDKDSFCEVTTIEGLDLEGVPTMTQRSRRLYSWNRLKTRLTFKRKSPGKAKRPDGESADVDGPRAETIQEAEENDEEAEVRSVKDVGAENKERASSAHGGGWFDLFSHRWFAGRRGRMEDVPARPSTANAPVQAPKYYEIETHW